MTISRDELDRLTRLRDLFLDDTRGPEALADYWRDDGDLAAYDGFLGERIGWKWDAVLAECDQRGFPRSDRALVVDFGCGTGIAARRFVARFGAGEVVLCDRSAKAMAYAKRRLELDRPHLAVRTASSVDGLAPDVLLVSHVLGEIDVTEESRLRELIARSRALVLVEPGSRDLARRVSALRDELRAQLSIVAPCTHAQACPALASGNDWCHFFAPPPGQVFTDGFWGQRARALGIDLRALPYSFLAAVRTAAPISADPRARLLGRPRVETHRARFQTCDATGLHAIEINKRHEPAAWRAMKKHPDTVRLWPFEAPAGDSEFTSPES